MKYSNTFFVIFVSTDVNNKKNNKYYKKKVDCVFQRFYVLYYKYIHIYKKIYIKKM